MLHDSDPGRVVSAGDDWAAVGMALHDHAAVLEQRLRAYDGMWRGTAAAAFHTMVGDLLDGVRQTADSALAIRDQVYHAGEALKAAWAAMPAPVDLPAPGPVLVDARSPATAVAVPAPPQVVAVANAGQATAAAV